MQDDSQSVWTLAKANHYLQLKSHIDKWSFPQVHYKSAFAQLPFISIWISSPSVLEHVWEEK